MPIHKNIDDNLECRFYTISGEEDYLDEDQMPRSTGDSTKVYAKATQTILTKEFVPQNQTKRYRYFIKTDPNRYVFNPIKNHTIGQKNSRHFINTICKKDYIFLEVSKSIFDKYTQFLKTKNIQILNAVQREIK
jgi:hypothetical protein